MILFSLCFFYVLKCFLFGEQKLHPRKPNMTMEKLLFGDVFPIIKNGDVPACHVGFSEVSDGWCEMQAIFWVSHILSPWEFRTLGPYIEVPFHPATVEWLTIWKHGLSFHRKTLRNPRVVVFSFFWYFWFQWYVFLFAPDDISSKSKAFQFSSAKHGGISNSKILKFIYL